ncbi:MAG: glycine cleavage system protein GcvH [Candidatus Bipolaricaulota bacterium]|nr:MAG: glycine cleavage system protein GcvH [Candidatus Bipolaricaulota bacterium]
MGHPTDLRYTKEHEWLRSDGKRLTLGITAHAQKELGDIVFVELPAVGAAVHQGGDLAIVESVKAVGEVLAPVSGTVVEINGELESAPQSINEDPYGAGWIAVIEMDDPGQVDAALTAEDYERLLEAA